MTSIIDKPWIRWIPAIAGILVYAMSIGYGFVLDDNLVLTQNVHVQKGIQSIPNLMSTNYAHGHQEFNDGLYRPMSLITFAIEKSFFDLNPSISHLIQILIYGILLVGLFSFLNKLIPGRKQLVFWTCMLFALHPIHTEVVANLKSRDELLALMFFCFSAASFISWLDSKKLTSLVTWMILFLCSLWSKESAVALLAIFPLIAWIKGDLKKAALAGGVALVPTAIFLGIRALVLSGAGEVDSGVRSLLQNPLLFEDSVLKKLLTASDIQGLYIQKLFLPVSLSHDYSYNAIEVAGLSSLTSWMWALIVVGLIVLSFIGLKKRKWWAFGVLFYFLTASVASNAFIQIGAIAAERFIFTPSLGFCLALVSIPFTLKNLTTQMRAYILIFIVATFGVLTIQRLPDWESNYTLFKADVDKVPESARANYNYGSALLSQAKEDRRNATEHYQNAYLYLRKAIDIWPDYQDAYNNLGVSYIESKNYEEALEVYTELVDRFPTYSKGHYNLSVVASRLQKWDVAESHLETYNAANPSNDFIFQIADYEGNQGKFDEAIEHLRLLCSKEPNKARGWLKLGSALAISGNESEAEEAFLQATIVAPDNADSWFNLALVQVNTGKMQEGVNSLSRCLELNPEHARAQTLMQQLNSGT